MNRKTIIISIIAVLALAAVPLVYAQTHHGHRGHGEGMLLDHLDHLKSAIGLSDDQVSQIKPLLDQLKAENQPLRQQLKNGHLAILNALTANPNDIAGAQALLEQQISVERTMQTNMLTTASKALSVLTTDQRTKLTALIAKHQAKHEQ